MKLVSRRSARRVGFTLVEVLLVLALFVLAAAVLLPSAGGLFRSGPSANVEEELAMILQHARREAVLRGREVMLRFDAEAQRFVAEGFTARAPGEAPVRVDFLREGAGSAVLIAGQIVETDAVPGLKFFPDGTCDPVRLQFRPARGSVRVMAVDPWTCAPGLEATP